MSRSTARRPRLLALLALPLLLAACGSDSGESDTASETPSETAEAPDLDGQYAALELPDPPIPAAPGPVFVTIEGNTISFNAGCNGHSGALTWTDGTPSVGEMASTQMACDQELMDRDAALAEMISGLDGLEATADGGLLITSGGVEVPFVAAEDLPATEGAPLEGTAWQLESYQTTDDDAVSTTAVSPDLGAGLQIEGDSLQLTTGCNSGRGPVVVRDGTLKVVLATTKKACEGEAGEVERAVLPVFADTVNWAIDGDRLMLTSPDGATALSYVAG